MIVPQNPIRAGLGLLLTAILAGHSAAGHASEPLPGPPWPPLEITPGLSVRPVADLELRSLYYGSDPGAVYCLENSEGDCLEEGYNGFADLSAGARIGGRLDLVYQGQLSEDGRRNKKAYIRLRTGNVSWEFGKDSVWIGNGAHGSLLLSNNAEGFLLAKLETESPFHLPWVFSRIGTFRYLAFHAWMEDARLFGHRLEYRPVQILSIGLSQTVFYNERFQFFEFPKILFAREENAPGRFDNDQRASMDAALYLPFLQRFTPFIDGKIYGEYAGEDLQGFWQVHHDHFAWPFGFKLLKWGGMGGLFLTTGTTDLRVEYTENYTGNGSWYYKFPFTHRGVPMGHHMGGDGDDWYFAIERRWPLARFLVYYDRERHGVWRYGPDAEVRDQVSVVPTLCIGRLEIFGYFVYARYRNADANPDPLVTEPVSGETRNEYTAGMGITVR